MGMTQAQFALLKAQLETAELYSCALSDQIGNIRSQLELLAEQDDATPQTTMHLDEEDLTHA
jgi:hypothetical protein